MISKINKRHLIGLSFIICYLSFSMMLTSCVDTVILPDDKTVDEDFWKSKSDVQLMVNGAYRSMLSTDRTKWPFMPR